MEKKNRFVVALATNQYTIMQSKQILEELFEIKLLLNDSCFEDGMLYRYRVPGEGHARITLYENYMPEVDEWKDPDLKQYQVIINFLGLKLEPNEIDLLKNHFEYLYSKQI
jgi:hypothetical protein